jgi:hypothetical protein
MRHQKPLQLYYRKKIFSLVENSFLLMLNFIDFLAGITTLRSDNNNSLSAGIIIVNFEQDMTQFCDLALAT